MTSAGAPPSGASGAPGSEAVRHRLGPVVDAAGAGAVTDTSPYDAVLCDLDNVIRYYDLSPLAALEREFGLPEGTTADLAYAPEVDLPVLLGHITPDEWAEAIARGLSARVAGRAGVRPERCLFVDDRQENIDTAEALGMTGVLFREPADLYAPFGFVQENG